MSNSSHRRNHKRCGTESRGFVKAIALLLSFVFIFTLLTFFPDFRARLVSAVSSLNVGGDQTKESDFSAVSEEVTGEEVLPADAVSGATQKASGTQDVQEIQVAVTDAKQTQDASNAEGEADSAGPSGQPDLSQPLALSFAGDVLLDDRYAIMASNLERGGGTPDLTESFDEPLFSLMQGADIFMVNNEFPYSDGGSPLSGKQYTFRAKPEYASQLLSLGVDIVALANNHMYDYGQQALTDTLDTLDGLGLNPDPDRRLWTTEENESMAEGSTTLNEGQEAKQQETRGKAAVRAGLPHVGAGRNIEEASAPVYFTNGVITVGIVAATQIERYLNPDTKGATETEPGVFRCLDSTLLVDKIREMKENCDFVIAYLHWGTESTSLVDEHQKKLAKEVAEAGADLIIGDHPHVLQGISLVEGVPVIYSLGNYLFNSSAQDTGLLTVTLDPQTAKPLSLQFIPARQENCRTVLLTGTEKARVIEAMRAMSDVSIDDEGMVMLP